jgi:2-polyprenyl-3-methyl-5-hydroxy-6-metoxy-1,4-benzoquinol methylase
MNKKTLADLSVGYKFNENFFAKEDVAASLKYFEEQIVDSERYWHRLGGRPDFSGKVVLDLGCGHGALSIDAAMAGAKRVIGIDLDSNRIAFARHILVERFPKIADRIEFHSIDIVDLPLDGQVDIVVSKDTFEHIMGIKQVLQAIKQILREDGLLITGFTPLYYSPFGDHGFHAIGSRFKLPWAHLFLGDAYVVAAYNKHHPGVQCQSVYDLGLNKLKRCDFRQAFEEAGFVTVREIVNAVKGASKLMPLFRLLRKIPGLEDYTTVNMYVVLRKS